MLYFQFHIGDWESGTRLMTPLEKGIYLELLIFYYSVERPITEDECKRIARGYANAEASALAYVLQTHFKREGNAYRHKKCDAVISEFHEISAKRSSAARKSAEARRNKKGTVSATPAMVAYVDANAQANAHANEHASVDTNDQLTINRKPITITKEEKEKKEKPARETASSLATKLQKPEGISDDLWKEWVAHKKKRCKSCTQRMVDAIVREASAAGISTQAAMEIQLENGWSGFKAEYVRNKGWNGEKSSIPFAERDYSEGINDDNTF